MDRSALARPIFFIGMPRSGTTVIFEAFARHEKLGWLSNYCEMFPCRPIINILCPLLDNRFIRARGRIRQYGGAPLGNRYLPQPVEAYAFWDYYTGILFSGKYLENTEAESNTVNRVHYMVSKVLKYERKKRFTTKITGPGRINYLRSLFPDAMFINVVRDGRSVVHSLLNVGFWRENGGLVKPFWDDGLPGKLINYWENKAKDPIILAGLQWRFITEMIGRNGKELGNTFFTEIRYEDFIENPLGKIEELFKFCGLEKSESVGNRIHKMKIMKNMNQKYMAAMSTSEVNLMEEVLSPMLQKLGYC